VYFLGIFSNKLNLQTETLFYYNSFFSDKPVDRKRKVDRVQRDDRAVVDDDVEEEQNDIVGMYIGAKKSRIDFGAENGRNNESKGGFRSSTSGSQTSTSGSQTSQTSTSGGQKVVYVSRYFEKKQKPDAEQVNPVTPVRSNPVTPVRANPDQESAARHSDEKKCKRQSKSI
jgi:hypothetical protein